MSAVWPEVSHRLTKLLASRGAAPDVIDDVVQEVAARVLAKQIAFDDAMDLMRWAVPVALNLLVDHARAGQRLTPVSDDHDQPMADIADLVAHRDRLNRVLRALPLLSESDRAVLTGPEVVPSDRKEAVRLAVRRHRARRRLLALVDGVAAFVALLAGLLRRGGRAAATTTVALAAAPVAFLLLPGTAPAAPRAAVPDVMIEPVRPVRTERVASSTRVPRTAAPAARRPARVVAPPVTRPPAAAPAPTAPLPERVAVAAPSGDGVEVSGRKRRPGDGVVCVWNVHLLGDVCVHRTSREPVL